MASDSRRKTKFPSPNVLRTIQARYQHCLSSTYPISWRHKLTRTVDRAKKQALTIAMLSVFNEKRPLICFVCLGRKSLEFVGRVYEFANPVVLGFYRRRRLFVFFFLLYISLLECLCNFVISNLSGHSGKAYGQIVAS
jgi:hypothetical protein